jgi:hypothetical protein
MPMPIEVIEENQTVAQIRIRCDKCGAYIGTRIVLQKELAEKRQTPIICKQCKTSIEPKFSSQLHGEKK